MPTSLENKQTALMPSATWRTVEFDTSTEGKIGIETLQNRSWDWSQIKHLLDEALYLTNEGATTALNTQIEPLAKVLYPFLPDGHEELRTIIKKSKGYFHDGDRRGTPEAKAVLRPYSLRLLALLNAARQKLGVMLCLPNQRNWDPRAYGLFQEFQYNLGRVRRVHFVTVTFKGNPSYGLIKDRLRRLKRKLTDQGFETIQVVSIHPSILFSGRMHAHLLVWNRQTRSTSQDKTAINKCKTYLKSPKSPFGYSKWTTASNRLSFLKVAGYMAWNYDQTIRLAKGPHNPIPIRARVLNRPKQSTCGNAWQKIGKTSLVSPVTTAWRKAIARYAAAHGRSLEGDRRWIWRERRHIREYLPPDEWCEVSVTGLDGHTYRVTPDGEDRQGNETYRLTSEERGTFSPTDHGLDELAKLQAAPGALAKNDSLDYTTGKTAYCNEVLGFYAFL